MPDRHDVGALVIAGVDPRDEIAKKLMGALAAEEALRYHEMGPDTDDSFRVEDVLAPRAAFLLACLDGQPVGCGALRCIDDGAAEINRVYVVPTARRQGIGLALLRELERQAADFGYRVIRLETGDRQPEAIRLYENCGFRRISGFGSHLNDPNSVFFEKEARPS
jgi:putative acetyltransferase